ncbi:uncharacterized protein LOC128884129 [Hylaeus volcanicus]|uniref:uncharacterized protein LOC128884129 n=1 Tax=Hylaeus volcanicus TaxID=313075 RepID=UPI0023B8058F|nr:uncharacterized protein LOC128884129 [Hylaeus volcanicus]
MDFDRQHEFKSTSWTLFVELAAETNTMSSVCISFRHLKCDSVDSIIQCCKLVPEIHVSGVPQNIDNYDDANNTILNSFMCLRSSTKIILDVSRNFFKKLNVIDLLDTVFVAIEQNHILKVESIRNPWVSTLNMSANDLKVFPFFWGPKHNERKCYKFLKFIYLNHNHIKEIPNFFGSSFHMFMPQLEHLDLRNNRLITIEGLPGLLDNHPTLQHLSLSGNFLTTSCIQHLPFLPNLKIMGLFANKLDSSVDSPPLHTLEVILNILKYRYPCLQELYLIGNPVVSQLDHEEYKAKVKKILPFLHYLDGIQC